jgi:hypothetical protein
MHVIYHTENRELTDHTKESHLPCLPIHRGESKVHFQFRVSYHSNQIAIVSTTEIAFGTTFGSSNELGFCHVRSDSVITASETRTGVEARRRLSGWLRATRHFCSFDPRHFFLGGEG